jgi:hypothetical protein
MQDDLPGIALLKEIFPEESTENLRLLHHQHIFSHQLLRNQHGGDDGDENDVDVGDGEDSMQQHEYNEEPRIESDATDGKPPPIDSPLGGIRQRLDFHHDGEQHYALPEDFLRLPISIAILRPISRNVGDDSGNHNVQESIPDRTQYKYELLSDLQRKVMNEYSLCNHCIEEIDDIEGEDTEFLCFAIKKHRRWGLGMTLQEDENGRQKYANSKTTMRSSKSNKCSSQFDNDDRLVSPIPFGLTVVSFLPDADKIKNGEIKSDIPRSPAQEAGIHIDDVLIGVNGSAFLLPRFSSELYTSGSSYDEHYNRQKTQIIKSIQASPDPIVVHVRRKRPKSLPSYSCTKKGSDPSLFTSPSTSSIQRSASLLDSTSKDEIEVFALDDSRFKTPPIKQAYSGPSNASTRANLRSSSSHKDPLPLSAPPPTPPPSKQFTKHPLAYALVQRKLIRSGDDEWRITTRLQQFTERTRQWESSSALRLKVEISSALSTLLPYFDPKDLPPEMAALIVYSGQEDNTKDGRHVATDSLLNRLYTPSTPSLPHDSPLIPVEYLQAFYGEEQARQITLLRSDLQNRTGSMNSNKNVSPSEAYPALRLLSPNKWIGMTDKKGTADSNSLAWVPLHGIRKSISARIVNSFVEEAPGGENSFQNNPAPRMAYTIWVYDVESGNEWYAPIRFWKDFCDLRDAAMSLLPTTSNTYREISGIKFPREPQIQTNGLTWGPALGSAVFGSRYSKRLSPLSPLQQKRRQRQDEEFEDARLEICCTLEDFLRELLGIVYTCQPLQPCVAEIALYVQSFLGVDAGTLESPASTAVFNIEQAVVRKSDSGYKKQVRRALKHSIQRYTWRIFLLHSMKAIVRDFVDAARARGLRLQDVEVLESQGKSVLKSKAAEELGKIQSFLDSLVDLIIDGCQEDFEGIARRLEYAAVHDILNDQINWDRLIRDAVREQVEIEVYIPLRSVVSRLLVNGWRHEDMESNFKIKVCFCVCNQPACFSFQKVCSRSSRHM